MPSSPCQLPGPAALACQMCLDDLMCLAEKRPSCDKSSAELTRGCSEFCGTRACTTEVNIQHSAHVLYQSTRCRWGTRTGWKQSRAERAKSWATATNTKAGRGRSWYLAGSERSLCAEEPWPPETLNPKPSSFIPDATALCSQRERAPMPCGETTVRQPAHRNAPGMPIAMAISMGGPAPGSPPAMPGTCMPGVPGPQIDSARLLRLWLLLARDRPCRPWLHEGSQNASKEPSTLQQ